MHFNQIYWHSRKGSHYETYPLKHISLGVLHSSTPQFLADWASSSLTFGGLTVSNHEGTSFVPWGQKLPLCIFPTHTLKEPPTGNRRTGLFTPGIMTVTIIAITKNNSLKHRMTTFKLHSSNIIVADQLQNNILKNIISRQPIRIQWICDITLIHMRSFLCCWSIWMLMLL